MKLQMKMIKKKNENDKYQEDQCQSPHQEHDKDYGKVRKKHSTLIKREL